MKQHLPLVIGNWKMNPPTLEKARELISATRAKLKRPPTYATAVVAPPFPFLTDLRQLNRGERLTLAAQDAFFETAGAHTGEVSLSMLKSVGVKLVILGHSERRARGESDEKINHTLRAALKAKLTPVVCVGERERDAQGHYFGFVEAQLKGALAGVSARTLARVVVAYEPVWAIGTGETATAADAYEMKLFIKKLVTDQFSRSAAEALRVLYGGSVKKANAADLIEAGGVDGFLIGGASLKPQEFVDIITISETYAKTNLAHLK